MFVEEIIYPMNTTLEGRTIIKSYWGELTVSPLQSDIDKVFCTTFSSYAVVDPTAYKVVGIRKNFLIVKKLKIAIIVRPEGEPFDPNSIMGKAELTDEFENHKEYKAKLTTMHPICNTIPPIYMRVLLGGKADGGLQMHSGLQKCWNLITTHKIGCRV